VQRVQVLSVRQPWAWAIARGRKTVENRTWSTSYRGPLAIHTPMRVDLDACASPLIRTAGWDPDDPVAAIGGIVAVVHLADVCTVSPSGHGCDCGEWATVGCYHWLIADARPLPRPVMALGQLGLWEPAPAPAVLAEVTAFAGLS
jgi:hypothetical protein